MCVYVCVCLCSCGITYVHVITYDLFDGRVQEPTQWLSALAQHGIVAAMLKQLQSLAVTRDSDDCSLYESIVNALAVFGRDDRAAAAVILQCTAAPKPTVRPSDDDDTKADQPTDTESADVAAAVNTKAPSLPHPLVETLLQVFILTIRSPVCSRSLLGFKRQVAV